MSRRVVVDVPVWQVAVAAGSAIICATTIGAGLVWGGLEYGRATAPTPAPTERVYTTEDLQHALDACGRDDVQISNGTTIDVPQRDDATGSGRCMLMALEAPGDVRAVFEFQFVAFGDSNEASWSNVHASWTVGNGGKRTTTITIQEA